MEKIVVVTGSFNPITKAHVELLTKAMEMVNSNRGIIVPTDYGNLFTKVTKEKGRMALSNKIRLEMINTICEGNNKIEVCDYEMKNKSSNRTYKTINYIIESNPDSLVYYVCGADKLNSMIHWNNIEDILMKSKVIIFKRSDINIEDVINSIPIFSNHKDSFIICDELPNGNLSSTLVRNSFFNNSNDYKNMLTAGVYEIMSKLNPSDYPIVDFYRWIENMYKTSGMHDKDKARKAIYEDNLKEFNKLESYKNKVFKDKNDHTFYRTIEIVNEDMISVSHHLFNQGFNPIIINVCNKTKPTGFYSMGFYKSRNDEEELCRCSDLSLKYNDSDYPILTDYPVLFNKVLFFRNSSKEYYKLLDKSFYSDVILFSALSFRISNASKLLKEDLKYKTSDNRINEEGIKIIINRLRNSFESALLKNNDSIVLGDLGIDSYYLPVIDIANSLKDVLLEYKNKFKYIILALPGKLSKYNEIIEMVDEING